MTRTTDFREGQLRIPKDRWPLPEPVERKLMLYAGPGRWEGNEAVFDLPLSRLQEIEAAFEREKGMEV